MVHHIFNWINMIYTMFSLQSFALRISLNCIKTPLWRAEWSAIEAGDSSPHSNGWEQR